MIERLITFSVRNKFLTGLFVLALICWGVYSLTRLPVDAIPDITNNQVQVISLAPSLAVQEVESFVTAPIEVAVANIPDIVELRSISRLGLSVITVVFKEDVDPYWARQQLNERLKEAEESIPSGVAKTELAPVSSGLGEIFQYRLAVDKGYEDRYNPTELRTLQDWVVRREMLGTPGVADINSYGGFIKQYEVAVNPERLRSMGVTLNDLFEALEKNNENTGGAYIDKSPNAYFIRGIGLVHSLEDIGKMVVKQNPGGMPMLIRDVATVQYGAGTRYGAFVVDTAEAVGGVVMMLKGANAHEVIQNVEKRIASIQKSLPEGVRVEPFLNRSDLVGRAINTVTRNLMEGALIVIFILVLLLGNWRAGLIVASVIPLSMLFAVSLMRLFGVSGNLMSLGAIDFGLIVDGAVIIVESVVHRIHTKPQTAPGISRLTQKEMDDNVLSSARRMMSSATFGQVIILMVYLPILALVGIEGKMFRPMAEVVVFALTGAAILSLTYVPMASALFLSKKVVTKTSFADRFMATLQKRFQPLIDKALDHKKIVTGSALGLFIASLLIFNSLGGEFIPQLEEGDLAAGVMTLQGGSLDHTLETVKKANKILLANFPEIKHAVCKIGAGEIPTDPTPMETGDYIITLKDKDEWTSAGTREELVAKMEDALVPLAGVKFEFQQPIQMRFNELISGSRQDIAVKIFGDNLDVLASQAAGIEHLIQQVEGVEDLNVEKVTGLEQIQVTYNRDRLAQYGLSVEEVNKVLRTAFAGSQAGVVYDEEKRFGLVVRLDKAYRNNLESVRYLSVALPGGGSIPLETVADVSMRSGPAQVSREDTKRRITIGFNVRNRDIQSVIKEVSGKIDQNISLPTGYYITYGGQFQNLEAARNRLAVAVPVALLMILLLLYFTFRSVKQSLLIFTAVPMSAIGGILALWLRGMDFSISAGIGFIALFGVAVLNGIVLIAEFNRLEKEGITDLKERVKKALNSRLRPVIMTASVASLGFLPMAISTSAGAEVQKPLATVVIGGLISATLLTLIILPVFYVLLNQPREHHSMRFFRRKTLLMIFLLTGFCGLGVRAASFDEKSIVETALKTNPGVRASGYDVQSLMAEKKAAVDIGKTSFEGQYGQFNSISKDNSLSITQSFEFPTVYANERKLADIRLKGGKLESAIKQLDLAALVRELYWQLIYLKAVEKLLTSQEALLERFAKAAQERSRTGETNGLESITARSEVSALLLRLQDNRSDQAICIRKLQTLTGIADNIEPADSLSVLQHDMLDEHSEHPVLALSRQQAELAGREKKLEQSKLLPDLTVGWFTQTIDGSLDKNGRALGSGYRFNGIQAGIALPVWFKPQRARIQAASMNEKAEQLRAEETKRFIESQRTELLEAFSKSRNAVNNYLSRLLPEARLITEQAEKSYQAGALSFMEYVLSIRRATEIQEGHLEAVNQLNFTVIQMDYFDGILY